MDLGDDELSLAPAPAPTNYEAAETAEDKARRRQEKREKREKRRQKKQSLETQAKNELEKAVEKPSTPTTDPKPTTPVKNGRYGPRGPYKKREKSADGTRTSTKKRNRESGTHADVSTATENGLIDGNSLLDPGFLQGLKDSMGDIGAIFSQQVNVTEPSNSPLNKEKRGRPPGKDAVAKAVEAATQKSGEDGANKTPSGENKAKKQKLEKARSSSNLEKTFRTIETPVPVPSVTSTSISGPKKTSVPLPHKSPYGLTSASSEPKQQQSKTAHQDSQVLATETTPSQMPQTPATTREPAIPFSLTQAPSSAAIRVKKTKKGPTVDVSSPILNDDQTPASAPAKLAKAAKPIVSSQGSINGLSSSQTAFTSSNLMSYKKPLNDTPKSRLRGRAASEATSTTCSDSSTSMSIKDMLTRVAKPYTRSGASIDPFVVPEAKKKKKHVETHEEADLAGFTEKYKMAQKMVNFTDEVEYLEEYMEWKADSEAAGPLPCLHKATGCSAKNETILHLQKEDASKLLKLLVGNEADAKVAEDAQQRAAYAETFLTHSIAARVPIPLGRIEGTWTLYCPKYSSTHVDKYGFGQRTLTISSIAGFRSPSSSYTARLSIPPRSMAYTILSFEAPPHASFRTTVMKTVAEGYKMDVFFLGNGYLKLRVDLHLLLMGKKAEEGGKKGRGIWEFLGVHNKATVWEQEVDELEVEGRRLCAKYDGGCAK
jgi:hypothetical protein